MKMSKISWMRITRETTKVIMTMMKEVKIWRCWQVMNQSCKDEEGNSLRIIAQISSNIFLSSISSVFMYDTAVLVSLSFSLIFNFFMLSKSVKWSFASLSNNVIAFTWGVSSLSFLLMSPSCLYLSPDDESSCSSSSFSSSTTRFFLPFFLILDVGVIADADTDEDARLPVATLPENISSRSSWKGRATPFCSFLS